MRILFITIISSGVFLSCSKGGGGSNPTPPTPQNISVSSVQLDGATFNDEQYDVSVSPVIRIKFTGPVKQSTVASAVTLTDFATGSTPVNTSLQNNDSVLVIQPTAALKYITKYSFSLGTSLKSASGGSLTSSVDRTFYTRIDSSSKFPVITDSALLTLVQQQTFKYFWDFAHPVCGMARERNTSGDVVTTGGTGFGIMSMVVAVNRNFITRSQAVTKIQTIVSFLKNTAPKFHGAFSHWMNGSTGAVVPFASNDDGADLVETSFLMMGLLTARQYFNGTDAAEVNLRNDINTLYNGVEWSWFRQNNQNVLYWNWSPNYQWAVNVPIRGWNECLITYVLAASSSTYGIPASVYANGFANSSTFTNGNSYYGYNLPLGPAYGGPLFFEHYSFMGINPNGLSDAYANYQVQTKNHTLINYNYCKTNPRGYFGYSDLCWGLTASDIQSGYTASSPTNDVSVIAPTAAVSSIPYTPVESMKALKFFYYTMGDKLWRDYGFVDAFSLKNTWFANSFLAIDQGPMIVMIENYRTGLIWNLFTSCPEVKNGMLSLGFSAPYL